jgi:hypothetical protein
MVGPGVGSVGLEVGEPHLWIRITFEGEDDEDFIADTGPITVY